jgi:archaellum biogenesis ATPase FlaH
MKPSELRELLNSQHEPGFEFIEDYRSYEREIIEGYTMETVKFSNRLDNYCPAKMGQLVTVVGHPNVGKTTVLIFLMTLLAKQGRKVLIYSAENRISTIHKSVARFFTGRENIGIEELQRIRSHFRYIKNERHFSYKDILSQSTYLLDAGFEWDFFLIDPYNALKIANTNKLNMHDYHYEVADYFRMFCMKTKKTIYLNTHTVTESQREKLDANGERKAPMPSMTEGGGKWINKSDDVMVLHRNPKSIIEGNKFITEVHVDKVRNQEFGGEQTPQDKPLLFKHRMDRTGFDIIGDSYTEPIANKTFDKLPF